MVGDRNEELELEDWYVVLAGLGVEGVAGMGKKGKKARAKKRKSEKEAGAYHVAGGLLFKSKEEARKHLREATGEDNNVG